MVKIPSSKYVESNSWIRILLRMAAKLLLLLPLLLSFVFLGQFHDIPSTWTIPLSILAWIAILHFCRFQSGILITALITLVAIADYFAQRPSHDRQWLPEVARLPTTQLEDNLLSVESLRDFAWHSTETFEERWGHATFDLNYLTGLEAIVIPFGSSERAAHVLLSFVFSDGRKLAVSVEARREIGESYSLLSGAARQFELIYLFGTESDFLGLRILHRGDQVYAFPLKVSPAFAKSLLLELCETANQLHQQPRFYATLRHNCTTTLLRHVNQLRETPISFTREVLFPAQLGKLLHRLGYLNTKLDWPAAKETFRIDQKIRQSQAPFSETP